MGLANIRGVPGIGRRPAASVIDGAAVAARVRGEVAEEVARLSESGGSPPALATVLISDDPASALYVAAKIRACAEAGIGSVHHRLPSAATREKVFELIGGLNADPTVSGILCQLPPPTT